MDKKLLKKLSLFLASVAGVTTITILACSGGDWDGNEGSMFTPEIINQNRYKPFFRSQATPFYDGYDDASAAIFKVENCKEWVNYLGSNVSKDAINYWLYEASLNQIDSMIFMLKKRPANLSSKSLSYNLKVVQPENKAIEFLYYLGFAKRNEAFVVKSYDDWKPSEKNAVAVSIDKQILGGINFLAKASNSFMKERYAFQLERLYFFNKEFDKAINVFNENETVFKSETNLKWRALSYKAGAFYRQKNYAQANYLFSKVYDNFEPLKKSAYLSFHPQQQADWNECLALAKTTREKEVLWQLFGLQSDYIVAMKEIIKLNPTSDLVDLLLVRAVNIEEEKFNGILSSDEKSNADILEKMDKNLEVFLNEMSATNKSTNPAIWHLAASYINYIKKNFTLGDKQLQEAEKYSKSNTLIKSQYHLISLVGKVTRLKELNKEKENELLADLNVLFLEKHNELFRANAAQSWIRTTLAQLAQKNGEYEKAELISNGFDINRFEKIDNLKAMISYCDKTTKSAFEKLFFEVSNRNKYSYVELLGIRYAQQDLLPEALTEFKSIPKYSKILLGNPFTIHINDCHDCDHEAKQKTKYSSISFIEKLIEMKGFATAKPTEAAQNYFLIANGFYNMTYFGNARVFYENSVSNFGAFYFGDVDYSMELNCELALKYYLLAKEKSNDKEFKAKCTFMAAKCEQNKFFVNKPRNYDGDFKSGIYFEMLKKDYATTNYYNEILKECGYYSKYINN